MTIQFPILRFTISGNSMFPTLKPGQDVLVWCWFFGLKVEDIVAIEVQGKRMIKRIHYILDREVVVLGDNEKESSDSRNFGPIKRSQIIGKVIWY